MRKKDEGKDEEKDEEKYEDHPVSVMRLTKLMLAIVN